MAAVSKRVEYFVVVFFPVVLGRPDAVVSRLRSGGGAGELGDVWSASAAHGARAKRSMSWLLAAVMSVCEEDPRRCRSLRRRRLQRLRGGGGGGGDGEFDADLGELPSQLFDGDNDVLLPLKRRADDQAGRRSETAQQSSSPITDNCRTENC